MIIAEMATTFENNGSSIYNEIIKIYEKYGWRLETTVPITKKEKMDLKKYKNYEVYESKNSYRNSWCKSKRI